LCSLRFHRRRLFHASSRGVVRVGFQIHLGSGLRPTGYRCCWCYVTAAREQQQKQKQKHQQDFYQVQILNKLMISEVHEYNLSHHVHYIECLRRRRRHHHPQSRRLSSSLINVPPILVSLFVVVVVVVCIHYYYINETQMRGQKKTVKNRR